MNDTPDSENSWEAQCKQCGLCCFEKLEDSRGRIIYLDTACKYLDITSRRCKIYERRFEINPDCVKLTPELVPTLHWLPAECGYQPPKEKFVRKEKRRKPDKRR